jgi:hypothetical protein
MGSGKYEGSSGTVSGIHFKGRTAGARETMLEFLGALWNFFLKLCATLLCMLFDAAVVIIVVLLIADRFLLSPDLYITTLEKQRIYERIPALAAEQFSMQLHAAQSSGSDVPPYLSNLTSEQMNTILTELLPADWLHTQTNSVLEQAFYVVNTPGSPLVLSVSLTELKNRLAGQAGLNAMTNFLRTLPACASGEIPINPDLGMPECRPPDSQLEAAKPFIAVGLRQAADQIPEQVDLLEQARAGGAFDTQALGLPAGPRTLLQTGRWLVRFSPLFCLAILLLVALLVVRSWVSLLRWWGGSILSAGISTVAAALAIWIGVGQAFSIVRENLPQTVSPGLFDAITGVISSVVLRVALLLGGAGALIAAIGLVILVVAFFLARSQPKKATLGDGTSSGVSPTANTPARLQEPSDRQGIFG